MGLVVGYVTGVSADRQELVVLMRGTKLGHEENVEAFWGWVHEMLMS